MFDESGSHTDFGNTYLKRSRLALFCTAADQEGLEKRFIDSNKGLLDLFGNCR